MLLKLLLGIWMAGVTAAAFLYVPPAEGFARPEAARIIFFHVPNAIVAAIAFLLSAAYAAGYLRGRSLINDAKSAAAAELGLVFSILATVTGSLFAYLQWNSWWNWDPRETSIVVLLLIYAAYFALRSSVEGIEKRAALSAVYALLALPAMVFLVFILPRIMFSLHPANTLTSSSGLSNEYRLVLYSAVLGFLGLFIWLFRIRTAIAEVKIKVRRY